MTTFAEQVSAYMMSTGPYPWVGVKYPGAPGGPAAVIDPAFGRNDGLTIEQVRLLGDAPPVKAAKIDIMKWQLAGISVTEVSRRLRRDHPGVAEMLVPHLHEGALDEKVDKKMFGLGQQAAKKGLKRAPVLDPAVAKAMGGSDNTLTLKSWLAGWDSVNLAKESLRPATEARGKVQNAILAYVNQASGQPVDLADLARRSEFARVDFRRVQKAAEALVKSGEIEQVEFGVHRMAPRGEGYARGYENARDRMEDGFDPDYLTAYHRGSLDSVGDRGRWFRKK